jgi:hypothetical protein
MVSSEHALHSSYREMVLEHAFIGDLLRYLWTRGVYTVEVLRSEVDASGYDIILEYNAIVRHVQLKSSFAGSTTQSVNVHTKLQRKPGGCVIWIIFNRDTLDVHEFLWFGNPPGEQLPDITQFPIAKHAKADSTGRKNERPDIRVISRKRFTTLRTIADVADSLFNLS